MGPCNTLSAAEREQPEHLFLKNAAEEDLFSTEISRFEQDVREPRKAEKITVVTAVKPKPSWKRSLGTLLLNRSREKRVGISRQGTAPRGSTILLQNLGRC